MNPTEGADGRFPGPPLPPPGGVPGLERFIEIGEKAYRVGYRDGWKAGWKAGLAQAAPPRKGGRAASPPRKEQKSSGHPRRRR